MPDHLVDVIWRGGEGCTIRARGVRAEIRSFQGEGREERGGTAGDAAAPAVVGARAREARWLGVQHKYDYTYSNYKIEVCLFGASYGVSNRNIFNQIL